MGWNKPDWVYLLIPSTLLYVSAPVPGLRKTIVNKTVCQDIKVSTWILAKEFCGPEKTLTVLSLQVHICKIALPWRVVNIF
jgi:hypothetical protein